MHQHSARSGGGCGSGWTRALLLAMVWAAGNAALGQRKAEPRIALPFAALGYPGTSQGFLDAGSSVLAVHFLDETHLLLSFGLRALVPRIPGDPDTDEDRMVAGEVVELPSGKVLARTTWHMHDHSRYLWSLGHGRFLLRIGGQLFAMNPLANLATADPFQLAAFPSRNSRQLAIFVSEDEKLVTLESVLQSETPQVTVGDLAQVSSQVTVIDFYRIAGLATADAPLRVSNVGRLRSTQPLVMPVDSTGYLWAEQGRGSRWDLSFELFAGKSLKLGQVASSCYPRLQMISPSEFLTVSCQGGEDKLKLASYGLDGHETWEESLGDFGVPSFRYAPEAARFGISHVVVGATSLQPATGEAVVTSSEEIRVYQNASGDLLLKTSASPAMRTQENWDLSPAGMQVAVAQGDKLAIYTLSSLSPRDRQDMTEIAGLAPPPAEGAVVLSRLTGSLQGKHSESRSQASSGSQAAASPAQAAVDRGTLKVSDTVAGRVAGGDDQPAAVEPTRKPPTLLAPGEQPEFRDKKYPQTTPPPG